MATKREIDLRINDELWFQDLSPAATAVYFRLRTNLRSNMAGLYRLTWRDMLHLMNMTREALEDALMELRGHVRYADGVVWIVGVREEELGRNGSPNVRRCIDKDVLALPAENAVAREYRQAYGYPLGAIPQADDSGSVGASEGLPGGMAGLGPVSHPPSPVIPTQPETNGDSGGEAGEEEEKAYDGNLHLHESLWPLMSYVQSLIGDKPAVPEAMMDGPEIAAIKRSLAALQASCSSWPGLDGWAVLLAELRQGRAVAEMAGPGCVPARFVQRVIERLIREVDGGEHASKLSGYQRSAIGDDSSTERGGAGGGAGGDAGAAPVVLGGDSGTHRTATRRGKRAPCSPHDKY